MIGYVYLNGYSLTVAFAVVVDELLVCAIEVVHLDDAMMVHV